MRPLELDTTIAIPKEVHDQWMWDHRKMTDGEVIAKSCRHLGKSHHASCCCCCWHCCCWRWTALLLYCCGRTGRRGSFCDLKIIVKWAQCPLFRPFIFMYLTLLASINYPTFAPYCATSRPFHVWEYKIKYWQSFTACTHTFYTSQLIKSKCPHISPIKSSLRHKHKYECREFYMRYGFPIKMSLIDNAPVPQKSIPSARIRVLDELQLVLGVGQCLRC